MPHNLVQERILECISHKYFIFHKTFGKAEIKFSQCRCQHLIVVLKLTIIYTNNAGFTTSLEAFGSLKTCRFHSWFSSNHTFDLKVEIVQLWYLRTESYGILDFKIFTCTNMRCFARFGTICTIYKTWKTPMEECYF